ncbi:Cell wall integrity sensor MID2 [Nakaseomyces glabratus]|uniref:Cell wall integrity sensor MID2 n=1 Tax=Candida glabrata TaxID=5478 RepID=A0A0W0D9C4_CANGB|nr:Cell wall integrity sensor MID2 [Nakaseomyces glabratus]KTB20878.1 Cell wall integrity sensor MID2 [Nakaseomyces glabratus]
MKLLLVLMAVATAQIVPNTIPTNTNTNTNAINTNAINTNINNNGSYSISSSISSVSSTILSDLYTTITYTPTATHGANNKKVHHGLSKKNRNIVIGCVVGIGVPLIVLTLFLLYVFCIRSPKTDFINSDGKVITAYRPNKITKWWNALMGREITEEYQSKSPLGGEASDFEDSELAYADDDDESLSYGASNMDSRQPNRNNSGASHPTRSNNLIMEEDRFYDEHGNELTTTNY